MKKYVTIGILTVFALLFIYQGLWKWVICKYYCEAGESLYISNKTGNANKGGYASKKEQGVQETMLGPGRHFLNPFAFKVQKIKDIEVPPGMICTVTNNVGKDLPSGRFIADSGEKGTQRRVLTPGTWRINPYGQTVGNPVKAKQVLPGYVAVQTLRDGKDKGILKKVLPPGLYYLNPSLVTTDEVEIGYREWTVKTEYQKKAVVINGKSKEMEVPKQGTGISFPLADGKEMFLDITVIWGLYPEMCPRIIEEYGNIDMLVSKVIEPQIISICKNAGSNYTTNQFIKSNSREEFQNKFTDGLKRMAEKKGIEVLVALVRRFHPDPVIQNTIQSTFLAEEEKQTLLIEQQRDRVAADLEQAKVKVQVAVEDFDAETKKLVKAEQETGMKEATEIREVGDRLASVKAKETADINAKAKVITGQAEADISLALKKAEAERYQLNIQAFGNPAAYNLSIFAQELPEDLKVRFQYSGPGTLWTNPDANLSDLATKKILISK